MNAIEQVRKALKSTPRPNVEIAAETGIHATTISRFKTGEFSLSAENLLKLAAALGMEIQAKPARRKSV